MIQVLGLVAPLFGLMALGYLAGKIAKLPIEGLVWLNVFVIYIALPAMFYNLLSKTSFREFAGFRFIAITTFATLLIFTLCFFIAAARTHYLKRPVNVGEAAVQGFAGAYGNVGYMGPPLALAAFGPGAIAPAALIFSFDNALHFTLAPMLMAINNRDERKTNLVKLIASICWKIISHPFILATIAGFTAAWAQFTPPAPVANILDLLAGAAAPCALFMMGVSAALRPLNRVPVELAWLVPVKLVLHPLLVYWMLTTLGNFPTIFIQSAVLLAALPSAANVFVIAQQYGFWQERASSAVIISTMASIATLSLTIFYLKNGF